MVVEDRNIFSMLFNVFRSIFEAIAGTTSPAIDSVQLHEYVNGGLPEAVAFTNVDANQEGDEYTLDDLTLVPGNNIPYYRYEVTPQMNDNQGVYTFSFYCQNPYRILAFLRYSTITVSRLPADKFYVKPTGVVALIIFVRKLILSIITFFTGSPDVVVEPEVELTTRGTLLVVIDEIGNTTPDTQTVRQAASIQSADSDTPLIHAFSVTNSGCQASASDVGGVLNVGDNDKFVANVLFSSSVSASNASVNFGFDYRSGGTWRSLTSGSVSAGTNKTITGKGNFKHRATISRGTSTAGPICYSISNMSFKS